MLVVPSALCVLVFLASFQKKIWGDGKGELAKRRRKLGEEEACVTGGNVHVILLSQRCLCFRDALLGECIPPKGTNTLFSIYFYGKKFLFKFQKSAIDRDGAEKEQPPY